MQNNQKTEALQYLEENVNIIIKPLMIELLKKRPQNVSDFIIDWIQKEGKILEENKKEKSKHYDDSHLP